MTPQTADEWVTVPEAARRLGLASRTATRYAAKLSATDRKPSASGGSRLVRLLAMAAIASEGKATQRRPLPGQPSATAQPEEATGDHNAALVAQLQSENGFLRAALQDEQANTKAEQENTRAALAELSRAREQAQILIAATAAGRLQLSTAPPMDQEAAQAPSPSPDAAQERAEGKDAGDADEVGPSAEAADEAGFTAPDAAQRGKWWQIWKR